MLKLHLFVVIVNFGIFVQANCVPKNCYCDPSASERLYNSNTDLTLFALNELHRKEPWKTQLFSLAFPMSTVALLAIHTDSRTQYRILRILNLNNTQEIKKYFPRGLEHFRSDGVNKIDMSMRLYVDKKIVLSNNFKKTYQIFFRGDTCSLWDFSNSYQTAFGINNWINSKINDPGNNLISPKDINSRTSMVFANTLNIKLAFRKNFVLTGITEIDFYMNALKTIRVPAIHGCGSIWHVQFRGVAEIYLAVTENNQRLLLIKPIKVDGLPEVLNLFSNSRVLKEALGALKLIKIDLVFALTKVIGKLDFAQCLQSAGILTELLRPNGAKFNNITTGDCSGLFVSKMVQKVSFRLDEGLKKCNSGLGGCPNSKYPVHVIDRPFVYAILCNENSPIAAGIRGADLGQSGGTIL